MKTNYHLAELYVQKLLNKFDYNPFEVAIDLDDKLNNDKIGEQFCYACLEVLTPYF